MIGHVRKGRHHRQTEDNMNARTAKTAAGWTLSLGIVGCLVALSVTLYDQVLRYL